jgi:hypothetical protein
MDWFFAEAKAWLQKAEIANAFGLVLYTDRHSNLAKVLNDDLHWRGFHDRTGPRWPVFALRRPAPAGAPAPARRSMSIFVEVPKEPNEIVEYFEHLGLGSTEHPWLVVFSITDADEALFHTVRLNDDTVPDALTSLRAALDAATTAIDDVRPENIKSAEGVHAATEITLTDLKQRQRLTKAMPLLKLLGKLFGAHPAP